MSAQTGKRYFCDCCGAEVIVTRGGEGTLYCLCGDEKEEMKMK